MFPVKRLGKIAHHPEHFKLLEIVPFQLITDFPLVLHAPVGDEINIALIDTETTGLNAKIDEMIEFGWVRMAYSPSTDTVTSLLEKGSMYHQPLLTIPDIITEITGITNEMVMGETFDLPTVKRVLTENTDVVVAHNKDFDKAFVDNTFGELLHGCVIKWGCTVKQINWQERRFPSRSLELLLLKSGYFYEAHRAEVDCLSLAWLLTDTSGAMKELLSNINTQYCIIRAVKAPFEVKDNLKAHGFNWDGDARVWHIQVPQHNVQSILDMLDTLYQCGSQNARIETLDIVTQY